MLTILLAARSLRNRLLSSSLTVLSIALSVALLVGIENVRVGMRESFSSTISQTDLIVGARGGSLQLLLSSVFGIGSPANTVSAETYGHFRTHPAVAWTIPYSLGDSHRGYRVIGTTGDFYRHYRFRENRAIELAEGREPANEREVVLGAEVARELGYELGAPVALSHGLGAVSFVNHDEHPFEVVGILAPTSTPVDRAVYVTLEGVDAIHEGWVSGAMPAPDFSGGVGAAPPVMPGAAPPVMSGAAPPVMPGAAPPVMSGAAPLVMPGAAPPVMPGAPPPVMPGAASSSAAPPAAGGAPSAITSFFVGTRSRIDALRLQRDVNTYAGEPVMAVLPGVALAEMWRSVGYAEDALKIVTAFVVAVGLLGMIVSLYTSLNERRREMAILRSIGARKSRIVTLLVIESGMLAILGCLLGVGLVYAILVVAQGPVESRFGLYVPIRGLGRTELAYIGAVIAAGFLLGLIPALKAYRNALVDGLSIRV